MTCVTNITNTSKNIIYVLLEQHVHHQNIKNNEIGKGIKLSQIRKKQMLLNIRKFILEHQYMLIKHHKIHHRISHF